jgi:transcriptional regulator of NAD metabolism
MRIVELLREGHRPITGSELSLSLGVSRQAIVNDMAILRAAGEPIDGSPQGYHWEGDPTSGARDPNLQPYGGGTRRS